LRHDEQIRPSQSRNAGTSFELRAIGGIYLLRLKLAMGFGGGMARTGKTCGAVTGVYMILGLSQHINENNARESIERTYKLIRDFNREFTALHGSLNCKDLIKLDLAVPEQRAEAQDKHIFVTVCPDIVRDAAKIMEILLATC
jgi:C_GCAxxG_C_C family probable redox protein